MKINLGFRIIGMFFIVFLTLQLPSTMPVKAETETFHKVATAVRISDAPPKLDGVLDDDIWKIAPLHEGFRQHDPDEGEPASERTTLQIAYDNEALYFGIMCYDSEPDKIVSRVVRRDGYVESDKIHISLDPIITGRAVFGLLPILLAP